MLCKKDIYVSVYYNTTGEFSTKVFEICERGSMTLS